MNKMNNFQILISFCLIFLSNSTVCFSQQESKIIHSYGLEDEGTIRLINSLLKDTSRFVVIMDESYFGLNQLLSGEQKFYGDEHPICDKQLRLLKNPNRIIGGEVGYCTLPYNYLSKIDSNQVLKTKSYVTKKNWKYLQFK